MAVTGRSALSLYLSLVFLSGIGVGAFGHRLYTEKTAKAAPPRLSHEEAHRRYIREHQTRLKLNDEQVARLTVILDETRARFKQARDKMDPEMKQIQKDQRDRTRAILTPDQRVEYEKMLEERDNRRRGGPPPPGR